MPPAAGLPIDRNPGVVCLWRTPTFHRFASYAGNAGVLLSVGEPLETLWYCQGRSATLQEVTASLASGLPILEAQANSQGPEALAALAAAVERARVYLPSNQEVTV